MTSVAQRAGVADRLIAAGEASKNNLKIVGTAVEVVTIVPLTVGGAAIGGVGSLAKGYVDAYTNKPDGQPLLNLERSAKLAAVVGGLTAVAAYAGMPGVAAAGVGEAILTGATALGVTALSAGVINAGAAFLTGEGLEKGAKAGIGAARLAGAGAQYVTDEGIRVVRQVAKKAVVVAENGVELGREGLEDVLAAKARLAQKYADLSKAEANAVANGGPRFDKDGKPAKDFPPDLK